MGDDKETGLHRTGSVCALPIRTLILALAVTATGLAGAWGAEPSPINTLHAIHSLTKADARAGLPVAFEATVTYYWNDIDLFVQEGGEAIYVETKPNQSLVPGDRVLVRGKTRDSFTPDILSSQVTLLHHGSPPNAIKADFGQLIRAELDCMRVTVRAKVRSADTASFGNMHGIYLKLLMDGGSIDATVVGTDASRVKELLDSDVEITGVVSGKFDSKMQLIGILLEVPSLSDVKIVAHAKTSPESLPITPMKEVLASSYVEDRTRRVRVQGTITYYQPGSAAVLQNGTESLWISTSSSAPMRIGDIAVATGFPDAREGFLELSDAEITDSNFYEPVSPQPATWRQLATWNSGYPDGHQNDLVSFEGQVMTAVREDSQDEFVLSYGDKLFTAIFRHPPSDRPLPAMRQIPIGTKIRVTGICMAAQANSIATVETEVPFYILLRSFDDIEIVEKPSWLNVRNLTSLVTGNSGHEIQMPQALQSDGSFGQEAGGLFESTLEFLSGDEALKALSSAEKFKLGAKIATLAEEHPAVAKLIQMGLNATRTGVVSGAQEAVHGGDTGDVLTAAGSGGLTSAASEGLGALAKLAKNGVTKIAGETLSTPPAWKGANTAAILVTY